MVDAKEIFRKKFSFALICLVDVTIVTILLKYDGPIFVQLVGILATGFFTSQAFVDVNKKETK